MKKLPTAIDSCLRQWQRLQDIRISRRELAMRAESYRNFTQQFKSLFDAIQDPILLLDPELTIVWANASASELFTGSGERLSGKSYRQLIEQRNIRPLKDVAEFSAENIGENNHVRIGNRLYEQKAFPMLNDDANLTNAVQIFRDITRETEILERKIHAGKLELLGELAAGVAHEINNPINGVINYADILAQSSFEPARSKDICRRIITEGERIAKIVKSLLNFAHKKPGRTDYQTDLHAVIEDTMLLSQTKLKNQSIVLEKNYDENLPEVSVDPQQLLQVLLNLISNSQHALQEKFPGNHPDKKILIRCSRKPASVQLAVEDFGMGIPKGTLPSLTEPFFTTKSPGDGTGLGLSICRQLIQENGGTLKIESRIHEYTKVIIELPLRGTQSLSTTGHRDH